MVRAVALLLSTLAVVSLAACGSTPNAGPPPETGSVTLQITGGDGVTGFQFDVLTKDGDPVVSRFVGGSGKVATFFTLAPGVYQVVATPMDGPGLPSARCMPAQGAVTVTKGQTTTVVLVARCQGPARGGLDVTGRVDHEPELTDVSFDPSTAVAPCQPVTITVGATDRDGDTLGYQFAVTSAPPGGGAAFTIESAGNKATFVGVAVGDYLLSLGACDSVGCVTLAVGLQIQGDPAGGAACSASCDDGNACTTDTRDSAGACHHAPVADGPLCTGGQLHVKLLGFNDFHGQLDEGRRVANRPVGGAAILASYLAAAQKGVEDQTILVHAGDHVGASPPDSALLQDEPSISTLNLLANAACAFHDKMNPACNIVGTLGNHEFDEGKVELLRLLGGGNFVSGPFLEDPYLGARYPIVSSNVVDELTSAPLLAPLVVKQVHGVPVAFIGAVLKETPTIVTPTGVRGLRFLDEADAINAYVPGLKAMGVHAIVVTIHQGGFMTSYTGPTRPAALLTSGPEILNIVKRLDDEIDVVISGHTHAFTNALVANASGKPILVTQAFSAGTAYADIDLLIDPTTHDVTSKTAQVVTTFGDAGPGLTPDPMVAAIVSAAQMRVAPLVNRLVGVASTPFSASQNAAGESSMGDLIADAQRAAMGTQFAFMNPGGIRANLDAGDITWGELFTIQPFGNSLVKMNLTGAQIYAVLEQQWLGQTSPRIMQISGFSYTWDGGQPVGSRVIEVRLAGVPIDPAASYSITCNNFMAAGGDNFTTFIAGTDPTGGAIDLDAMLDYVEDHTPITATIDGRIQKL